MASRRLELAAGLFGLENSQPPTETQRRMAERIAEVILADMIGHSRKGWAELGAGALVIRAACNDAIWSTASDIQQQRQLAESSGDHDLAETFSRILQRIERLNIEEQVLIAIADHRGLRLLELPVSKPAAAISQLLKDWP